MKKSVSKWIALLLSVVMIVMCAAGCSKTQTQETATDDTTDAPAQTADTPAQADEPEQADAPEQAEPVTITFWHTYGDSEEAQFLNVVMPLWESLHPEIRVEAVRQDSSQYHQMIVTSFGTGMSPDVARVDIANIAAYAKQGGLAALSDYPDFAELSASYLDAPLSTNLYQGKYYGLPLDTNCKAAVVNTNVLKELAPSPDNTIAVLCGPPIMIKFTLAAFREMGFKDENIITTLERRMKCGIGICGRCNLGGKYVCLDGPVFSQAQLNELPPEM